MISGCAEKIKQTECKARVHAEPDSDKCATYMHVGNTMMCSLIQEGMRVLQSVLGLEVGWGSERCDFRCVKHQGGHACELEAVMKLGGGGDVRFKPDPKEQHLTHATCKIRRTPEPKEQRLTHAAANTDS